MVATLAPSPPLEHLHRPVAPGDLLRPHPLPTVSVVIPSFNRRDSLAEVLDALGRQTYPAGRLEVVVVLDGSQDGSQEMLAARRPPGGPGRAWGPGQQTGAPAGWPALTAIWQPNRGAGAARNRGAATARGELLLFLDDDVVPEPQLVEAHARAHRDRPGGVVLGHLRFATRGQATVVTEWDAAWYERHFADLARPDHPFACWDFFAGNVSLTREDFLSAGGFDERFTNYGCEDWELGLRLLKAGRRYRFCPAAAGEHRSGVGFSGWLHRAYWDGRSEVRFVRKHPEVKHGMQLAYYYQGSWQRRLGRRLLGLAPPAWPPLLAAGTRLYYLAARAGAGRGAGPQASALGGGRGAGHLAKLLWTYQHLSGLRVELGGRAAVERFLGLRVPVLAYHRVTERPHPALAEFAVSPRTFQRQLSWLRASGHHVISLADLYDAIRGGPPLPPRPVVITFDDGYEDTATVAAPILRRFGYPATVFVVAGRLGGRNDWDARYGPPPARLLHPSQLAQLQTAGVEIGAHTRSHADLRRLSDAALADELGAGRADLEGHLGRPVRWLAYPYGQHDERVRRAAAGAGYLAAFAFDGGFARATDDLFRLHRIPVSEADGVAGFAAKLALGEDLWTAARRRTPRPMARGVRRLRTALRALP